MASSRTGKLPVSRPREASRIRTMEGYNDSASTEYLPSSFGQRNRRGRPADEPRTKLPTKLPSRLPSTTSTLSSSSSISTRRPSITSSQGPRPALSHNQPQSGTLSNTVTSGRSEINSGSSSSSRETGSFARNVLHRRRASALTQETDSLRNNSRSDSGRTNSTSSNVTSRYSLEPAGGLHFARTLTASPTDLRNVPVTGGEASGTRPMHQTVVVVPPHHYPELANRYQHFKRPSVSSETSSVDYPYRLTTDDLPPPTPGFISTTSSQLSGVSASPSTRFSDSPGPGPYSRDTTPTSMASQSPGLAAPMRMPMPPPPSGVRLTGSPAQTRPPVSAVTRRRAGSNEVDALSADPDGLAAVRESLTSSSSSNSTVRDRDGGQKEKKTKLTRQQLSPPPPSPPPRTSSKHAKVGDEANTNTTSSLLRRPGGHRRIGSAGSIISSLATGRTVPSNRQGPIVSSKATPPPRPSRDGTPDIQSQLFEPLRVIHSNLPSTAVAIDRRGSEPAIAPSSLSRSITPSDSRQYQQRLPSTSGRDVDGRSRTTSSAARAEVKKKKADPAPSGGTIRTPSPSVSSSFNKTFGFLRRKTAPDVTTGEKDKREKPTRKGPAAGTGHEGYGRLGAARRRSGGSVLNTRGPGGAVPSSSSESLISHSEFTDPFLRDRLSPVVIRGGEVVENYNIRTESQTSSRGYGHSRQASSDSKISSEMSTTSEAPARNALWPSAFPRTAPASSRLRRPSESSAEGDVLPRIAMKGTLAHRRSMQKLRATSPKAPAMRMPQPINIAGITSPSYTSLDSNIMSDDSEAPARDIKARKGSMPQPKKLTKPAKSPRNLWPFGRSRSQPPVDEMKRKKKKNAEPVLPAQVKVVRTEGHAVKHQAFYEILSEQEDSTGAASIDERVRETLRDADVYDHPSPKTRTASPHQLREMSRRPSAPEASGNAISPSQTPQAATLPTMETRPMTSPPRPTESLPTPPQPQTQQPRSRRLREVGRIPKVVPTQPSRSDVTTRGVEPSRPAQQTSPMSFSRPFNRMSIQMPPRITGFLPNNDKVSTLPAAKSETPELTAEGSTLTGGSRELSPDITRAKEFISFVNGYSPPRKGSESTIFTTSSVESTHVTAAAPLPAAHEPLVEDEIWDEYNDLLVDDSIRPPPSATSPKGLSFVLGGCSPKGKDEDKPKAIGIGIGIVDDDDICACDIESPTLSPPQLMTAKKSIDRLKSNKRKEAAIASSVYSVDLTDKLKADFGYEEPTSPGTPFSLSRFVLAYGDKTDSVEVARAAETERVEEVEIRMEPSPQSSSSKRASPKQPLHRGSGGSRKSTRSTTSATSRTSEEEETPVAQVNLRVGSMTVSKWLTFGHVLFSPAREQLLPVEGSLKRHSILVIDGLGNDDWSFYAAETYAAATFYNLSPRAPVPRSEDKTSSFPLSPPNHHQIQYTSQLAKFPFGPESFTSVVYRFPPAAPESHYRNIVTEARRVLKPGGYIELSILDVDLNSMGSRGRRQIRHLKERIREKSPETSLGSTADLMLRLLGKKGFVDIKTCRVGVPVASSIARSNSTSSRSGSRRDNSGSSGTDKRKEERSLAEMMSDESEVADEGIAKMVSRVGRWWYTRCYESAAGVGGSMGTRGKNSIWSDANLMRECEDWGTSLKLMVCYERVPDDGRSRVASI